MLRKLAAITKDLKTIAVSGNGYYYTISLLNAETGKKLKTLSSHSAEVRSAAFSSDGKKLISESEDRTLRLWNLEKGREIKTFGGYCNQVISIAISSDEKIFAGGNSGGFGETCLGDIKIILWDMETGKEIRDFQVSENDEGVPEVEAVALSPNNKLLAGAITQGSESYFIKLWDIQSGKELKTFEGHTTFTNSIAFSPDNKMLASRDRKNNVKLWNVENGQEIKSEIIPEWVQFNDNKIIKRNGMNIRVVKDEAQIQLINADTKQILATLVTLDESDWAVVTPDGRFDASERALKLMHYAYGLEVINLEQLKEMYYEPGLLQKLLGYSKEPLRPIVPLKDVKLYPEVIQQKIEPNSTKLTLKLKNRGGGIGEVRVLVNDNLAIADARSEQIKANPFRSEPVTITIDLAGSKYFRGQLCDEKYGKRECRNNKITVITSNYLPEIKKGNIQSRGIETDWQVAGKEDYSLPSLYAIVGGVSDYEGDALDLNFAAKDAEDFSRALMLGARRLFCPKEKSNCLDKVQVKTLSTSGKEGTIQPTKENFRTAFAEIAARAKPEDIVLVYLSGHGVSFGSGTDTYFYLTKEARSASKEDLAKVYQTAAISSAELTEWLTQTDWLKSGEKGIKALKQVLILDTCAAGTAAGQLALTAKKDLSGDQIRAIEFLKDKTGTHVLMGSTADAPSYEASQFGQGLLTYALLEGMSGKALQRSNTLTCKRCFATSNSAFRSLPKISAECKSR